MYYWALDGYGKVLGPIPIVTYSPLLNTLEHLANLYVELVGLVMHCLITRGRRLVLRLFGAVDIEGTLN